MHVAVVGLGAMGSAIAGRLLDGGHDLRVWNRSAGRGEELTGRGAVRAGSVAEAVRDAEVVVTSLSDDAAVRAVVAGEDGVAAALGASAVLVDASTVSPDTTRAVATAVGGRLVACPILGAPAAVAAGEATLLVGGEDGAVSRVAAVLDGISSRQLRCGPAPSATTAKICANLLLLGQLSVLAETVATGQANGLPDDLLLTLGRTPLVAPALQNRLEDVVNGDHAGWFSARLGLKDVRLARSLAAKAGLDLAVATAVDSLYVQAVSTGLGDRDITAVVEAVRSHRSAAEV